MTNRFIAAAVVVLAVGGCGGDDGSASGDGGDAPRIELKYPSVEQQIRDCKINGGHPEYCEVRERCLNSGETDTYCRAKAEKVFEERDRKEQEEAARENEKRDQRRTALDQEWDELGCGDVDPQLTEAEQARCDELANEVP